VTLLTYEVGLFTLRCKLLIARREVKTLRTSKRQTARDPRKSSTRDYVRTLRGKFKGRGLLKALMADKKKERRSN
jgi:hypothetical protein